MMHKYILMFAVVSLMLVACKTSEQNYRSAYTVAKEKESTSIDEATQARIDNEKLGTKTDIDGIEVRMKAEQVKVVEATQEQARPAYGVVVGSFKQVFNAKMFRKRLAGMGYPALVVINAEGEHYVIIKGCDTEGEAAAFLNEMVKKGEVKTPIEPFVLAMP